MKNNHMSYSDLVELTVNARISHTLLHKHWKNDKCAHTNCQMEKAINRLVPNMVPNIIAQIQLKTNTRNFIFWEFIMLCTTRNV